MTRADTFRRFPMATLALALQNAELVLIPNVGHNPHLEAPEIFNRELIRFLGSEREVVATER